MPVSWNLTKKLSGFKKSDVLIISIGKSGRTWLRVMLNKYISLAYEVPFGLDDLSSYGSSIPSIVYTHEMWTHLGGKFKERILGKYIVPDDVLSKKKVVLLYRDPRDVVVSLYFHSIKRGRKNIKDLSLMDLVVGRRSVMPRMVQVLNNWRNRLAEHPDCLWISYEDLMADTCGKFTEILKHIEFSVMDEKLAMEAIEFSRFENMKKMEAKNKFGSKILRPGDPDDPDSYKVRKGEVGGYRNYFDDSELHDLDKSLANLDPFFEY